ncbi:RNA polymerase-binding protein [Raineyella antarctica]|uniref:RNA polymerase-binding protein RbpA n=1 Tax=Raineyella antarctica TaxID=1577474 RepID=A0A1G6GP82_9ACTN|nr:RNA polymerase-binding protein RbpA [Raineyella antarctica]SDB82996.1 RNA polymerase-binding protein [Raineyella antarctica]
MADRSLRGSGLGAKSFEDEVGVDFAPRREVGFDCPQGHHFEMIFAEEAELPTVWECPRCGQEGRRSDGVEGEVKEAKHVRTHWDMLLERRSLADLEELLSERLEEVRQVGAISTDEYMRRTTPPAKRRR